MPRSPVCRAARPRTAGRPADGRRRGAGDRHSLGGRPESRTSRSRGASVGWVEPISTVTVRARVEGEVDRAARPGGPDRAKGDLLFRIDDREIQAALAKDEAHAGPRSGDVARAQADLSAPATAARRSRRQQQVDQTEADAKIAAANLQADQAAHRTDRIRLGYHQVRAPIDGRVGAVRVTPGNIVRSSDGGEGLVTITQMKPLRVTFTLPERDLPPCARPTADGVVPVTVYAPRRTPPGRDGRAELHRQQRRYGLRHDHRQGHCCPTRTGRCGRASMSTSKSSSARSPSAVTDTAGGVQPGQDGPFVYMVGADGKAAVRKVTVGDAMGDAGRGERRRRRRATRS